MASLARKDHSERPSTARRPATADTSPKPDSKPSPHSSRAVSAPTQRRRPDTTYTIDDVTDLRKLLHVAEELQSINLYNAKELYKRLMKDPELNEQTRKEDKLLEGEKEVVARVRSGKNQLPTEDDLKEFTKMQQKLMEENADLKSNHQEEIAKLMKVIEQLKEEVKTSKAKIQSKDTELKKVLAEKNDALTRLSKQMGQKLSDNNPTIADLSDPNRAMKLAEKYSELYDNEWTDALEILTTLYRFDEEAGVKKLLDILTKCYKICKDVADNQIKSLEMTLVNPGAVQKAWEEGGRTLDVVEKSTLKALKDCRKEASVSAMNNIYFGHAKYKTDLLDGQIPDYVKKCIELCWLMCVQDPPVVLSSQAVVGERLDTNMFKAYTNSGTIVSYNVWPPLLLNEGGPLLAKGIAQPMKVERTPKSVANPTRSTATTNDTRSRRYPESSKTVYNAQYRSDAYENDHEHFSAIESPPRSKEGRRDRQFSEWTEPYQHHIPSSTDISRNYRQTYLNEERNQRYYDQRQSAAPAHLTNYQQNIVRPKKGERLYYEGNWYYEQNGNFYEYYTDRQVGESSA